MKKYKEKDGNNYMVYFIWKDPIVCFLAICGIILVGIALEAYAIAALFHLGRWLGGEGPLGLFLGRVFSFIAPIGTLILFACVRIGEKGVNSPILSYDPSHQQYIFPIDELRPSKEKHE